MKNRLVRRQHSFRLSVILILFVALLVGSLTAVVQAQSVTANTLTQHQITTALPDAASNLAEIQIGDSTTFSSIIASSNVHSPLAVDSLVAPQPEKKLTASDAAADDEFGYSVSVSGDTAVVGAYGHNSSAGAVYIFERNQGGTDNWGQVKKITSSDAGINDKFGYSVSLDGDTLVVGAPGYDVTLTPNIGQVTIFSRDQGGTNNWGEVTTVLGAGATAEFGHAVSISDDTIIVGSPGYDIISPSSISDVGRVTILERNEGGADNWGQVAFVNGGMSNVQLGRNVAISGDTALARWSFLDSFVKILDRNEGGSNNWGEVRTISGPLPLGSSLSIDGDTAVIGITGYSAAIGSASIISRHEGGTDNWGEIKEISASDGANGNRFGTSVSMSGGVIAVGAYGTASDAGAVYIYKRNSDGAGGIIADNWGEFDKITTSDAAAGDQFGIAVGISGDTIIAGANFNDDAGNASGSAYVNERPDPACWATADDGATVYYGTNGVVQAAVATASPSPTTTLKIAGTCTPIPNHDNVVTVDKSITLQGGYSFPDWSASYPITSPTWLDGVGLSRVISITAGVTVTLQDLTIQNGSVSGNGGGIYSQSALTLDNIAIQNNGAIVNGGGIFNGTGATLTLTNSSWISGNQSSQGGGIYNIGLIDLSATAHIANNTATATGGGIFNASGATLNSNGPIHNNQATAAGGVYNAGVILLNASHIYSNTAVTNGGGIYNASSATSTLNNSQISANGAARGGGIYNDGTISITAVSQITNNIAITNGGGIYNRSGGISTIHISQVGDNQAASGGGLYNESGATSTVSNSTLSGNTATGTGVTDGGGGIYNRGLITVSNSTLSGNSATGVGSNAGGGGIYSHTADGICTDSPQTIIRNSTLSGNTTAKFGGAFHNDNGVVEIANSTITTNTASPGNSGGVWSANNSTTCSRIDNSIIVENPGDDVVAGNTTQRFYSLEYNLIGTAGANVTFTLEFNQTGDQTNVTNSQLLPLADNGGDTQTHALLIDSPATNAGDCSNNTITIGQNGQPRPNNNLSFCDIGSYENPIDGSLELTIGQNFRKQELTDYGNNITNLPTLTDTFKTYDGGSLFYRYCSDFDQLELDLTSNQGTACLPGGPATMPNNVHNTLRLSSLKYWQGAATYQGIAGQETAFQMTISGTMAAFREQGYISMIYGNEFYADAVRYRIYNPNASNIIVEEMEQFELAHQQFNLVTLEMVRVGQRPLPVGFLSDYFGEVDLEMFAIASRRQGETALEIAKLEQRQGNNQVAIDRLEEEYGRLQHHLILFVGWTENFPDPAQVYADNYGNELAVTLEILANMADSFRSSSNPLGYRDDYVPLATFDALLVATWGSEGDAGYLLDAKQAEDAARAAFLLYEQNQAEMNQALLDLDESLEAKLIDLCGTTDWSADCVGGAMEKNRIDLLAAGRNIELAYQRVGNITRLILIEEELAGQVIVQLQGAAQDIALSQLAIGKLNAVQTVSTNFATDTDSKRREQIESVREYAKAYAQIPGPSIFGIPMPPSFTLEIGVEASHEDIWATAGEQTWGTTRETVTNPNEAAVAAYEARQVLREAESNAVIVGAESAAEVQRLLLQQSDALIELDIAMAEYNAVLTEHNLLVAEYQDLRSDKVDVTIATTDYYEKPSLRLIHDSTSRIADDSFDRLINYAFLTAKALEYELLDPSLIPYQDLYTARLTAQVRTFLTVLDSLDRSLIDTGALDNRTVSLAVDVLGLTNEKVNSMLPFTVDPFIANWPTNRAECNVTTITQATVLRACLVQEFLQAHTISNTNTIEYDFGSSLEKFYPGNIWNAHITPVKNSSPSNNCSFLLPCTGVSINIATTQPGYGSNDHSLAASLTHDGQSAYIRQIGIGALTTVHYAPGPARFVGQDVPAGYPSGGRFTGAINASINGGGGSPFGGFELLSPVTTGWEMRLFLNTAPTLTISLINDVQLTIQFAANSVQERRLPEIEAEIASLKAKGQPVTEDLLVEAEAWRQEMILRQKQDAANAVLLNEMVAEFKGAAGTDTFIDPNVSHGLYTGVIGVAGFTEFGIDIGASAVSGTQSITATLCTSCSAIHNTAASFTGTFVETATPTDTFSLASAPFMETIGGLTVTKVITLSGIVIKGGDIISGTYYEQSVAANGRVSLVASSLFASRPKRVPGAITPTVGMSTGPGSFPSISWSSSLANCGYQLYRAGSPYFASHSRQLVTLTNGTSFTDTHAATVAQPIYYVLRSLSCNTNFDYLESDASFYRDTKHGAFAFGITPGG